MSLKDRLRAVVTAFRVADHPHRVVRRRVISSQAQQAPAGLTLYLGDSNVEMALLDGFNAGIGSARVPDVEEIARGLLPDLRPSGVVLSVGVNDARRARPFDARQWEAEYRSLLHAVEGFPVTVMGVDPVEEGKPLGPDYFAQEVIEAQNAILAGLCANGATFVPPRRSSAGLTTDGVHNNTAGFSDWRMRLAVGTSAKA